MQEETLWWATARKKEITVAHFWGFYLFGFQSVLSQDGEGEKIGNRPTHPGEIVCPEKVWKCKEWGRHTTTVPHCNTKLDGSKRRKWERVFAQRNVKMWHSESCCHNSGCPLCWWQVQQQLKKMLMCLSFKSYLCIFAQDTFLYRSLDKPYASHQYCHMLYTFLVNLIIK